MDSFGQHERRTTRASTRRSLRVQIEYQQIDRPILQKHPRHRQRFLQRVGREDDQPFELNAPGHSFHRIEASSQVQVRGYSTGSLNLRYGSKCQRGLAAGPVSPKRRRRRTRQATEPEDAVQRPKAGRDRTLVDAAGRGLRREIVDLRPLRHDLRSYRQRSQNLSAPARSGSAPPFPEGRESSLNVGRGGCHRTLKYRTNVLSVKVRTALRPSKETVRSLQKAGICSAGPVLDSPRSRGDVAQLGEHRVRIAGVRGSSPLISTNPLHTADPVLRNRSAP
jgi:hypothetical protein